MYGLEIDFREAEDIYSPHDRMISYDVLKNIGNRVSADVETPKVILVSIGWIEKNGNSHKHDLKTFSL